MPHVYCELFYFEHDSGDRLFPVRLLNRSTGTQAYRVSRDGNTKADHIELQDDQELLRHVRDLGYSARARCKESGRNGLYSPAGHSIVRLVVQESAA